MYLAGKNQCQSSNEQSERQTHGFQWSFPMKSIKTVPEVPSINWVRHHLTRSMDPNHHLQETHPNDCVTQVVFEQQVHVYHTREGIDPCVVMLIMRSWPMVRRGDGTIFIFIHAGIWYEGTDLNRQIAMKIIHEWGIHLIYYLKFKYRGSTPDGQNFSRFLYKIWV